MHRSIPLALALWLVGCSPAGAPEARSQELPPPKPDQLLASLEARALGFGQVFLRYETPPGGGDGETSWHRLGWFGGPVTVARLQWGKIGSAARTEWVERDYVWRESPSYPLERVEWRELHPFLTPLLDSPMTVQCALAPGQVLSAGVMGPVSRDAGHGQLVLRTDRPKLAAAWAKWGRFDKPQNLEELVIHFRESDLAVVAFERLVHIKDLERRDRVREEVRAWRRLPGGDVPSEIRSLRWPLYAEGGSGRPQETLYVLADWKTGKDVPPAPLRAAGEQLAGGLWFRKSEYYQSRVDASPDDPHYRYQLAHHLVEKRRYASGEIGESRVVEALDALQRIAPRSPQTYELRLAHFRSQARLDPAVETVREATRHQVCLATRPMWELAEALLKRKRREQALWVLEYAVSSRERRAGTEHAAMIVTTLLHKLYRELGRDADADALVARILSRRDPGLWWASFLHHQIVRTAGPEEAARIVRLMQAARERQGKDANALSLLSLGVLQHRAGQPDAAAATLRRSLAVLRSSLLDGHLLEEAYGDMVGVHRAAGRRQEAHAVALEALRDPRLERKSQSAWRLFGALRSLPPAELVPALLGALGSIPLENLPALLDCELLHPLHRDREAWDRLTAALAARAAAEGPDRGQAQALLGLLCYHAGDDEAAVRFLQAAVGKGGGRSALLLDQLASIAAVPLDLPAELALLAGAQPRYLWDLVPRPLPLNQAGELLRKLALLPPGEPRIEHFAGVYWMKVGQPAAAGDAFERAARKLQEARIRLQIRPRPPATELQVALIEGLTATGRFEPAGKLIGQAFDDASWPHDEVGRRLLPALVPHALATRDTSLLLEHGRFLYERLRDPAEQAEMIRDLVRAVRGNTGAEWRRAQETLIELLDRQGHTHPFPLLVSGSAASKLGRHEGALVRLRKAVSLDPSAAAHLLLARACSAGRDRAGAAEALEAAIGKLRPHYSPYEQRLRAELSAELAELRRALAAKPR